MKRLIFVSILSLLMLSAGTATLFYIPESRPLPIEMIAFNSLDDDEQGRIKISPKDSTVTKVTVDADLAKRLGSAHYGTEVYAVMFRDSDTSTAGNLTVYVDAERKHAIGKKNAD